MSFALGPVIDVNTDTANVDITPDVAALAGGGFVAVWAGWDDGAGGYQVFARLYDDLGAASGPQFEVLSSYHLNHNFTMPEVHALTGGGFVVTALETDTSNETDIVHRTFDADGSAITGRRGHNAIDGDQYSYTALSSGGFVKLYGDDSGSFHLDYFDSDGVYTHAGLAVHASVNTSGKAPEIAELSDGSLAVAWSGTVTQGGVQTQGIHVKIMPSDPAYHSDAILIKAHVGDYPDEPQITDLGNGRFVVAWETDVGVGASVIELDATGPAPIDHTIVKTIEFPSAGDGMAVTALDDGGFAMFWVDQDAPTNTWTVFGRMFDAGGNETVAPFIVSSDVGFNHEIDATLLGNGDLVVSWTNGGNSADPGDPANISAVTIEVDDVGGGDVLTADEEANLTQLWNLVIGADKTYKAVTNGILDYVKKTDGSFDGTAFDALLESSMWQQVEMFPGDYDPEDLQDLLKAAAQMNSVQEFLDHVRNTPLLGKVKVGTIADKLPDLLEMATTLWDGYKAINRMLKTGDTEAGYEAVEGMLLGIMAGGATGVITSSGAAVTIGGVLTGAGFASVVTIGAVTFSIGLGVAAVANEINKAYDVTGGISDLYRTALIEWHSGGFGINNDDTPRNITGDYYIVGADGADMLFGQEFDDTLYGSGGDDVLDGGAGADEMHGGTGNDTYYVDNVGDKVFDVDLSFFSEDIDTVYSTVDFRLGSNLDNLFLQGSGDLNGTGNTEDNQIRGTSGSNRLDGGRGDDIVNGFGGHDTLIDGKGTDKVIGGEGDDTLHVSDDNKKDIFNGGAGVDTLVFDTLGLAVRGQTLNLNKTKADGGWGVIVYRGIENVIGNAGADFFTGNDLANLLQGNGGKDTLYGKGGQDILSGNGGADFLYGGAHADTLNGGAANDHLEGGAGGDRLFGALGDDTMKGGAGADYFDGSLGKDKMYAGADQARDHFVFLSVDDSKKGLSNDIIFQFNAQHDVIDLSGMRARFAYNGFDGATSSGLWLVNKRGGDVLVRGDVDGDGKHDFQIRLDDVRGVLGEDDFIL